MQSAHGSSFDGDTVLRSADAPSLSPRLFRFSHYPVFSQRWRHRWAEITKNCYNIYKFTTENPDLSALKIIYCTTATIIRQADRKTNNLQILIY